MKIKLKKGISLILIFVILASIVLDYISPNKVYAETLYQESSATDKAEGDSIDNNDNSVFEKAINGAAGFILYPIKILPLLLGRIIQKIMAIFTENNGTLSVEDILFNRVDITSIDFFDFSSGNETIDTIRQNVAEWYYGLRNIATVTLFVILMYVGLRMALSTIAEEKATYSQMIINWLLSIALLYVLHFIIVIVITLNNQIVSILSRNFDKIDPIEKIYDNAWSVGFVEGFGNAICYLILVFMTLVFLISYLKRMITVGFLIVIAPLVSITYSIDKMGDNRSQALNTWFKEFCYNILIQPFQCVSYIILASSAMKVLDDEASLSAMLVAIMMILFIYESERIIRHIFHFEAKTMAETVSQAALVGTAFKMATKGAGKVKEITSEDNEKQEKKNAEEIAKIKKNTQNMGNLEYSNPKNYETNMGQVQSQEKKKKSGKVRKAVSAVTNNKLFQSYANVVSTGTKMLLGTSYLATGSTSTFLNNESKTVRSALVNKKNYKEERSRNRLQQAYSEAENAARENFINNLVMKQMNINSLDNLDENQKQQAMNIRRTIEEREGENITEHAKNFIALRTNEIVNGKEPTTEEEKKILEAITDLRTAYQDNGMNENHANTQIIADLGDIRKGKYKETTHLGTAINEKIDEAKDIKEIAKETGNTLAVPARSAKKFFGKIHKK